MAQSNLINSTRLEMLSKDNYDTWKIQVEALLVKNDAWGYISGEKPRPVVSGEGNALAKSQQTYDAWASQDRKAKSDLILAISPSELKQVRGCNTSKEVWDKLETIYASKGPARKATLLKQLTQHKMPEGADVRDHLSKFFDAVDKLQAMEVDINEDLLTIMLLYSLPSSFENFRCAIESRDALPSVENLKVKIIEENDARSQKNKENESGAMFAKHHSGSNKSKNGQNSQSKPGSRTNYKCSFCKKPGHKYAECFSRKRKEAEKSEKASLADEAYLSSTTTHEAANLAASGKWCLDSGCTSHLCNDKQSFRDSKEVLSGLKLASNATTQVKARGNVLISTSDGKKSKSLILENTLYVPDLRNNLLSVAKIVDKRHEVLFKEDQAIVRDRQGNVRMVADRQGDLFYLRQGPQQACTAMIDGHKSNANTWHERLGHINSRDLTSMQKNATGLKLKNSVDQVSNCKICAAGKFSSSPFPQRIQRSSELLEIVHTDLCGPMRTQSIGGARYFMTITDDYSRWCEVYFLHSKSEVALKFTEYKNYVETQTGWKIKVVQSDNGKEYCNATMDEILKKAGIRRRLTTVHTPQQNGVAERKNRTLVESARCMMIQAGLPSSFWAEAIATANHIRNRCVTKSLDEGTPFEKWTGRKPDIRYFRMFGCKVYVLDKSPSKGKFDAKGIAGTFVGYSGTSKAYRIWIPSERKIRTTRDVKFFDEFMAENRHEDIVTNDTLNGKFRILNDAEDLPETPQDEIGQDRTEEQPAEKTPTQTTPATITPEPAEGDNQRPEEFEDANDETPIRRGPGRPTKGKTGKRGRPKLFNMIPGDKHNIVEENSDAAGLAGDEDAIQDDADTSWHDDQFAMLALETPFATAISGPDSDEWKDAILAETKSLVANDT